MDPFVFIFSVSLIILGFSISRNWRVDDPENHKFSIIIACRNEEKKLPDLFKALSLLNYPENEYEILLVDDASTDKSLELIKGFCRSRDNASFFEIKTKDADYLGKKAALKLATENAKYDFFLFTDADCRPTPDWINSYRRYISPETGMIVGSVYDPDESGFTAFTNKIKYGLFCSTIGLGLPFSASGGNLVIRKSVFLEVDGYERIKHHRSGDDKLMLNLIKKTKWQIRYNPDEAVLTSTPGNNKIIEEQMKRRFGKFFLSSLNYQIVSIIVLLFYVYLPLKMYFDFNLSSLAMYMGSILFFWLMYLRKHHLQYKNSDLLYLLFYPYFLIYYSFIGTFSRWEWKG